MLELINLDNWKKVDDIRKELEKEFKRKVSRREVRNAREKENDRFYNGETEYCIARGNKGYIRTKNEELVIISENKDLAQATDLFIKVSKSRRARKQNANLKFEINGSEMYLIGI